MATANEDSLLFMENEHYALVDALPYIDTQLGSLEVAHQVKAIIDEEMTHFEPRDYLASLPAPALPRLSEAFIQQEFDRIERGEPMKGGIDVAKYKVEPPQGNNAQDHGAWRKVVGNVQMQVEYNRLRLTNLELLERWGKKAWVANSAMMQASERLLANEATALRQVREEVNKKRKLDQVSCGNELRKLGRELEQFTNDNAEADQAVWTLEADVARLRKVAKERGVDLGPLDDTPKAAEGEETEAAKRPAEGEGGDASAAKKTKTGDGETDKAT